MTHPDTVDITPAPGILRTLGEIPLDWWQCLAELIDNSLDAIYSADANGTPVIDPCVSIEWSDDSQREVTVSDNCHGMTLDEMENAVKAGYTSNDPMNHLGLFGMGFNIATARMGRETLIMSTRKGDSEWVGIRINFSEMEESESHFLAPVATRQKDNINESGTKVSIKDLNEDFIDNLQNPGRRIRRRLGQAYSPILEQKKAEISVLGRKLSPRPHCVWGESRFVEKRGNTIPAKLPIDEILDEAFFDVKQNRYLSLNESGKLLSEINKGKNLPDGIIKRPRRLQGWIGVQRYFHTADFGLDFIRNGRKILIGNKDLFSFENPETGVPKVEYPADLGTSVGGRIVGELHVDYLIPTYQKNDFIRTDKSWGITVRAIRGEGPLLPRSRSSLGYPSDNTSPLGLLANAYRRTEAGTKNLAIPRSSQDEFLKKFRRGVQEYISDDKWYKLAQQADRKASGEGKPDVDSGADSSDEPDRYDDTDIDVEPQDATSERDTKETTGIKDLKSCSEKQEELCGSYAYSTNPGLDVTSWRTKGGAQIKVMGKRVPCTLFFDGAQADFFYDDTHPLLSDYPLTAKYMLLIFLAEKLSFRDSAPLQDIYFGLVERHLEDERLLMPVLQEQAYAVFEDIKERLPSLLSENWLDVLNELQSIPVEEENLISRLMEEVPNIFESFQKGSSEAAPALAYVSNDALIKLIERFPDKFFDSKVFDLPYQVINVQEESSTSRLREEAVRRIISPLDEVKGFLAVEKKLHKEDLLRMSQALQYIRQHLIQ